MPIREYECSQCGRRVERLELAGQISEGFSMSEVNRTPCEYGSEEWEEVFTSIPFRLKGSGFHVNDYGRPKNYSFSFPPHTRGCAPYLSSCGMLQLDRARSTARRERAVVSHEQPFGRLFREVTPVCTLGPPDEAFIH